MSAKRSKSSPSRKEEEHDRGHREARGHKIAPTDPLQGFTALVDQRGRVNFTSEALMKDLGYHQEEILKKHFWEIPLFNSSDQATQRAVRESLDSALEGEASQCQVRQTA